MKRNPVHSRRIVSGVLGALACVLCLFSDVRGQVQTRPSDHAPPPMRFIPESERTQLSEERDIKDRTRLSLKLADERLARALQMTESKQYERAATELGIYQALIEDAMKFLHESGRPSNKNRDHYKRIEMTLRAHGPRIETIRRMTPSEDAVNVKAAYEYIRNMRTEALNAFYGDTVVREGSSKKEKSSSDEPIKATSPKPPEKEQ
jgi:hypothetical protein